jgi:effector-binding domain-containing protein
MGLVASLGQHTFPSRNYGMTTEPKLEHRDEQPYAAIRISTPIQQLGEVAPPVNGEVLDFLQSQGISPNGPPFWRYVVVDMERELELEVGSPVAAPIAGNERVVGGVFPAGNYVIMHHTGHPAELQAATGELLAWGEAHGVRWQASEDQKDWVARIEFYLSDPDTEPDMTKWETELAFLVADA